MAERMMREPGLTTQILKLRRFICGDADGRRRGGAAAEESEAKNEKHGRED